MIELWHNPRCSKSRRALALLHEQGAEVTTRLYLEDTPTEDEITVARRALGQPQVIDMMRPDEKLFKELGLSTSDDNTVLITAMVDHPILIERPIAIRGDQAAIGRPPERVLDLL